MTTIIEAIYEGGLFRPTEKVDLQEGTRVEVRVCQSAAPRDAKAVSVKLNQLAARAPRRAAEFTARNHDQILYGERKPA